MSQTGRIELIHTIDTSILVIGDGSVVVAAVNVAVIFEIETRPVNLRKLIILWRIIIMSLLISHEPTLRELVWQSQIRLTCILTILEAVGLCRRSISAKGGIRIGSRVEMREVEILQWRIGMFLRAKYRGIML